MSRSAPVLVLGGTGFLGGAIARALVRKGERVRVMAREGSPRETLSDIEVEWVEGDLRDPESVLRAAEGTRAIVHAAGHYPTSALRPRATLQRGVREMRSVLDAARAHRVRLLYISSLSTVGRVEGRFATEDDGYVPGSVKDPYFEVKYAMERELLAASRHDGIDGVVLLPSIVLGPGDVKPTSGRLILALGRERLPFAIDGPVNVIDVRDMADACVAALDKGRTGERYLLAGENLTLHELFRRIAFDSGVGMPRMVSPKTARRISLATEALAFAGDLASRPFQKRAPRLARRLRRPPLIPLEGVSIIANGQPLDSSKARRELGLRTRPLADTLRDTITWFRDRDYLL